jgi:hypothetical protein
VLAARMHRTLESLHYRAAPCHLLPLLSQQVAEHNLSESGLDCLGLSAFDTPAGASTPTSHCRLSSHVSHWT